LLYQSIQLQLEEPKQVGGVHKPGNQSTKRVFLAVTATHCYVSYSHIIASYWAKWSLPLMNVLLVAYYSWM